MLNRIKALLEGGLTPASSPVEEAQTLRVAAAALLVEIATIDRQFDDSEKAKLSGLLTDQFGLSEEETLSLTELAQSERENATSLHQFTRVINEHYSRAEKFSLLENMWSIAFADGQLDKYEEYMIRKVCDLIHMDHGDFIRAKHHSRPTP